MHLLLFMLYSSIIFSLDVAAVEDVELPQVFCYRNHPGWLSEWTHPSTWLAMSWLPSPWKPAARRSVHGSTYSMCSANAISLEPNAFFSATCYCGTDGFIRCPAPNYKNHPTSRSQLMAQCMSKCECLQPGAVSQVALDGDDAWRFPNVARDLALNQRRNEGYDWGNDHGGSISKNIAPKRPAEDDELWTWILLKEDTEWPKWDWERLGEERG